MDIFHKLWDKISANEKLCFFSALFFGFFTHTYMLTHKLPNGDDSVNFQGVGVASELGRWFLPRLNVVTVKESNPWFNGILTLVLISLACVVIFKTLNLQRKMSAVLVSAIVMTFPSLASTMSYMFTMDLYAFGLLLAVLSAYLATRKNKWLLLPACVCLICSMGLYQAYICFTITLLLMVMLSDLLKGDEKGAVKIQFITGVTYAVFLALSTVMYIVTCRTIYPGIVNEQEHNVGNVMSSMSLIRIPRLIARAYRRFLRFFVFGTYSFVETFWQIINIIILVLILSLVIVLLLRYKKDKLRIALALFVFCLLPLGNSFVDIMAPDAAFSTLMIYQFCLVYVELLVLLELFPQINQFEKLNKPFQLISFAGILCILLVGYLQFRVTSIAYFHTDLAFRHSIYYLERVIGHVEATEGYEKNDPILILGDFDEASAYGYPRQDEELLKDLSGIAHEHDIMTQYVRESVVNIFLGKQIPFYDSNVTARIQNSAEYQQMGIYPGSDSIRKIDEYWVVKISE